MCGRLTHTLTGEDYRRYLGVTLPQHFPLSFNVAPAHSLPVVRLEPWGLRARVKRWGFSLERKVVINAHSETVAEKPLFRESFLRRRSMVFVSGYYEWRNTTPYHIRRRDGKPLALAGLWRGRSS